MEFMDEDSFYDFARKYEFTNPIKIIHKQSPLINFRLGKFDHSMGKPPRRKFTKQFDLIDYLTGYNSE